MKDRSEESSAVLGSHSVLAKVLLAPGIFGLILAMDAHPAAAQSVRTEEVIQLLCDAVGQYDFVETGILPELAESISLATLAVEPNPRGYRFDSVIPLRHAKDRGNYMVWNTNLHEWEIRPFNPNYLVTGEKIMLLVKEKA